MKFFYNEIKEKQNYYQLACFFQNAWMSKDGWAKLAQLKKEAAQARTYKVGDDVRLSKWILSKQDFSPDYGISSIGTIRRVTEKAVEVTVDGKHSYHTFWCPKSQIESDGVGSAKGNPQAQLLLDRYEMILKKLEENRKDRNDIEHDLNKIPYTLSSLDKKLKDAARVRDSWEVAVNDARGAEKHFKKEDLPDIEKKYRDFKMKYDEIFQKKQELLEKQKQLQKQVQDIKQRVDEPLILELGRIERDLAKLS